MKHKVLALLLAVAMLAALPACGNGGGSGDAAPVPCASPEPPSAPAENGGPIADGPGPAQSPEPAAPEESPSDAPGAPAVNVPASGPAPSQSAAPAPSPSQSADPSQPPAPSGSASVDLEAFYETLCEDENFAANMPLEGEFLTNYYSGLSDIAVKQQVIYTPMISAVVCEIALVEVENAADVDAVKGIFQARIDAQVGTDENPGMAFYPESVRGWKEDSRIVSNGNYVMLIAWAENCDTVVTAFNDLF